VCILPGLSSVLDDDGEYDDLSEDEGGEGGEGQASGAASEYLMFGLPQFVDKMWKVKAEQVDRGNLQGLTQQTFSQHFGIQDREQYKALAVFTRCSDAQGRLRTDKLCRMLDWPSDRNRVMARIISCFDGDGDSQMDFREFLMVAAMHMHNQSSQLEKVRFWWWVMLFTDETSVMAGSGDPRVARLQVVKMATEMNSQDFCAPLATLGRFLRDFLASCTGLKISKAFEVRRLRPLPCLYCASLPSLVYLSRLPCLCLCLVDRWTVCLSRDTSVVVR